MDFKALQGSCVIMPCIVDSDPLTLAQGALKGCRWNLTSGAEAACSVLGSHLDTVSEKTNRQYAAFGLARPSRLLADFHELRQDFSPPKPDASNKL